MKKGTKNFRKLTVFVTIAVIISVCFASMPCINFVSGAENLKVEFSKRGGFYDQSFMLELSTALAGGEIYYTLDGTDPDPKKVTPGTTGDGTKKYTATIEIKDATPNPNVYSLREDVDGAWWNGVFKEPVIDVPKCMMVKAVAVNSKGESTLVETNSYFVEENFRDKYGLPVISLVTDPENLFGQETGIYVRGHDYPKGIDSQGAWPRDYYNMLQSGSEWERPAHLEIYNADGTLAVSQGIGIRLHGTTTKSYPQKTVRVYAKKEYDENASSIKYNLFPGLKDSSGNSITSFKKLLLRNSGNDWEGTMFADITIQKYFEGMPFSTMAGTAAVMYLDGEFWGITNIRERYDSDYISSHYNVKKDDVVMLEMSFGNINVDEGEASTWNTAGDDTDFRNLRDYILKNNMENNSYYEYVKRHIDIDNYISYHVAQLFIANTDWPHNNMRVWRSKGAQNGEYGHDGKWRWMLYDADFAMGMRTSFDYNINTIHRIWGEKDANAQMFTKLFYNQEFRKEFNRKYVDYLNTYFVSKRITDLTIKGRDMISGAIAMHNQRFNYIDDTRWGTNDGTRHWTERTDQFIDYASKRTEAVRTQLKSTLNLQNQYDVKIIDPASGYGDIKVGDCILDESMLDQNEDWTGIYYKSVNPVLQAIPKDGKVFDAWELTIDGKVYYDENDTIEVYEEKDVTIRALYKETEEDNTDLVIGFVYFGTDNTVPVSNSFVELYNPNNHDITLTDHYSLQYKSMDETLTPDWQKLDLTGTVPAKTSFLVDCGLTGASNNLRLKLENFDQVFDGFKPYNKGVKAVIMKSTEKIPATLKNPFTGDGKGQIQGYVDMYGVSGNDDTNFSADGYETERITAGSPDGQSKQKGFMRISPSRRRYADTDNNLNDFAQVDFRNSGTSIKPRSLIDGTWEPVMSPRPTGNPAGSQTPRPTRIPKPTPIPTPSPTGVPAMTPTPEVTKDPAGSPTPGYEIPEFSDVSAEHWAYTYITELAEKKIINGYEDGLFRPEKEITREEFAKILILAYNKYDGSAGSAFLDVEKDSWYEPYVGSLEKEGLTDGKGEGKYGVGENISRQDMATFMARAVVKYEDMSMPGDSEADDILSKFKDVDRIDRWAKNAVALLTNMEYDGKKIIDGYEDSTFLPKNDIKRQEVCKIVNLVKRRTA